MTLDTRDVDVAVLRPYHKNARRGNVGLIADSLRANGQYRAITVNRGTHTGREFEVLTGNHTLLAARELGWETVACHIIDVDDEKARRIVLVDNKANDDASYDFEQLLEVLREVPDDLSGTGFTEADFLALEEEYGAAEADPFARGDLAEDEDEAGDEAPEAGTLLRLVDLGWTEPKFEVHGGEHWTLGHHHLLVVDVHKDHAAYRDLLTDGVLFAPYPNPYVTLTDTAKTTPFVLVQPRPILAAHLLDKHASIFGASSIARVQA